MPAGARAEQFEPVSFPSLDGTVTRALVFQPAQAVRGTAVALHGCGGIFVATGDRNGQLNARHQAMANLLVAQGYAVVFQDLMLGEKDEWTPPAPCIALGRAVGAEVNFFADSHHDFDNPVGVVKLRKDVPNGVNPGRGVHARPNPAARAKAYARLTKVLRTAFNSSASESRPLSP